MTQLELPLDTTDSTTPLASDDRPCYLWLKEPWSSATYSDNVAIDEQA